MTFPFAAVAGMDLIKRALVLLAVDPLLKGVLIAGDRGTAKTVLARSFPRLMERQCTEVPLGVTADCLVGVLDLERTLRIGERQLVEGLLSRAHNGLLFVDDINLLDRGLIQYVVSALNSGTLQVERDGLSAKFQSDFALVGTYDPQGGEISPSLLDSVGIHVHETGLVSSEQRTEVLHRVLAFDRDPLAFAEQFESETHLLRARITEAQRRLRFVKIKVDDRRRLSSTALALGVPSHRADIFAVRLARANAALTGRNSVFEEDLAAAIGLVLLPRALVLKGEREEAVAERQNPMREGKRSPQQSVEELIAETRDGRLPDDLLDVAQRQTIRREASQAGRRKGNRPETTDPGRGRYVRAVAGDKNSGRIAVEPTLRAAAPFQIERRRAGSTNAIRLAPEDLRFKQLKHKRGILIVFAVDASGSMALNRISQAKGALIRLLQHAYVHRDKVALVSFRGNRAEVALSPTRSVVLAKRALDAMTVGGGTPLAAGLETALQLARTARNSREVQQTLLAVFTDGSANVPRGNASGTDIWAELGIVCAALRSEGVSSAVIDTRHRLLAGGQGAKLAEMLGGRYVYLPRPDGNAVHDAIAVMAEAVRG
jgi:magnesium chelatase subunit D